MTRVLIVEPGYCPYQAAFDSPQAAISEVIEGDSLLLKPFGTSKIGVVCSKNQSRLKYNRQLEDGCTIRGRFLVCGLSESKMLGLSKEQAERYNRLLFFPQVEDMGSVEQTMKNFLYSLFIGLFGIAGLTSIAFLLMYAAQSKQQAHLYSDLAAVRKQDTQQETASEPEKQASYQNLYWENTDMVGWILIEDTNINYPVMQTPTDPTYYLKHDFEKNYTDYGCPFMQADCDAQAPSDNLIIYGHNMKDGSMFADLAKYGSKDFWQAHKTVWFDTELGSSAYEIFAVIHTTVQADAADVFAFYLFVDAATSEKFADYVSACKARALYDTGISAEYGDKLLTLSTCDNITDNGRLLVIAKQTETK